METETDRYYITDDGEDLLVRDREAGNEAVRAFRSGDIDAAEDFIGQLEGEDDE